MNPSNLAMVSRFLPRMRGSIVGLLGLLGVIVVSSSAFGQAGLREALERLDINQNGQIDPSEITPQARPYIERITHNQSKSWKEKEISIERLTDIARRYYYGKNGGFGRELRPEGESTIKPFGPDEDEPLVPDFGLAIVKYPYIQADLDLARQVMGSYDRNRDGFIDRREAGQARKWTHRNPFDDDLNKDDRISVMELTQRYARRRLVENMSQELEQKRERVGTDVRPAFRKPDPRRQAQRSRASRGSSSYLARGLVSRFDTNRNGRLEINESLSLGLPAGEIDLDQDGNLTREELTAYLTREQEEAGKLVEGLPEWFYVLDRNRDQQVSMGEYTKEWTESKFKEFSSWDSNGDGLVTIPEVLQSETVSGGSYTNKNAEILSPRRTMVSEIEVTEDYPVGDLDLQISITHSYLSFLDCYLTGPAGQRIELFTEVGGSDDHFDRTIFDDQSPVSITRANYPFKGYFQPEAVIKKQPSLSHFNGKSVKGIWQLTIRGQRSDRIGMLNGWALIVQPEGQVVHRKTAPLGTPTPSGPGVESRPGTDARGGFRLSVGGRSFSVRQPEWSKMSPEEIRRTKAEMAKRGLNPSGRPMTDAEKQRAKEEYYRKKQSESGQPAGAKKEFGQQRPVDQQGRLLTDVEIRRRANDEIRRRKEEYQNREAKRQADANSGFVLKGKPEQKKQPAVRK